MDAFSITTAELFGEVPSTRHLPTKEELENETKYQKGFRNRGRWGIAAAFVVVLAAAAAVVVTIMLMKNNGSSGSYGAPVEPSMTEVPRTVSAQVQIELQNVQGEMVLEERYEFETSCADFFAHNMLEQAPGITGIAATLISQNFTAHSAIGGNKRRNLASDGSLSTVVQITGETMSSSVQLKKQMLEEIVETNGGELTSTLHESGFTYFGSEDFSLSIGAPRTTTAPTTAPTTIVPTPSPTKNPVTTRPTKPDTASQPTSRPETYPPSDSPTAAQVTAEPSSRSTTAPTPSPTQASCNGDVNLCNMTINKVLFPVAHEAIATNSSTSDYHQLNYLRGALSQGCRGVHLTLGKCDGKLELQYPGGCSTGSRDPFEIFYTIYSFAAANPDQVLVVFLDVQSDVNTTEVESVLAEVDGFRDRFYNHDSNSSWPTLKALIDDGEQILFFAPCGEYCPPDFLDWSTFVGETSDEFKSTNEVMATDRSCSKVKGGDDFFAVHHYVDPTSVDVSEKLNAADDVKERLEACAAKNGFVSTLWVDFWSVGDVIEVVANYNSALANQTRLL